MTESWQGSYGQPLSFENSGPRTARRAIRLLLSLVAAAGTRAGPRRETTR